MPEDRWGAYLEAVDRAFAVERPERFTNLDHCDECREAHQFFSTHTPGSLADVSDPLETLPVSFLTDEAFVYLMPAFGRLMTVSQPYLQAPEVLFHLENRLHAFTSAQRTATRDLLYAVYEHIGNEIEAATFAYETLWRILNVLDGESETGHAT